MQAEFITPFQPTKPDKSECVYYTRAAWISGFVISLRNDWNGVFKWALLGRGRGMMGHVSDVSDIAFSAFREK